MTIATTRILAIGLVAAGTLAMPSRARGAGAQFGPIKLRVDLTRAPQHVFRATEIMPASPGTMTLYYPKYVPGEHGPRGPINGLVGLRITAHGKRVAWHRDPVDMYTFRVDVPAGAHRVEVRYDFLSSGGARFTEGTSTSPVLADLEWNQVVLYPAGHPSRNITYEPTLTIPRGWDYATALVTRWRAGNHITFRPVTLNNLVDSPVITGEYLKQYNLTPRGGAVLRYLDVTAQYPKAAELKPALVQHFRDLIVQAQRLFGSHHYTNYHFLLTLSDNVSHFGLEHHQSSDDRLSADAFLGKKNVRLAAPLLPHEYVHSWNGKFRRPAKLWQPDFQTPEYTRMLWVYEGLTQYWGLVLAARSHLFTGKDFRRHLAFDAARFDVEPGRRWRPLIDTAVAAQLLYRSPVSYRNFRRGVDFYGEGVLIWLDVDTLIRKLTHDDKSLDDFARAFYGIDNGSYVTRTYTFDDLVAALNKVAPYRWGAFLRNLLDNTSTHAPLAGIARGGWKLTYTREPNEFVKALAAKRHLMISPSLTVGAVLKGKGHVMDVLWNGPAFKAGMAPGMTIISVDGQEFSPGVLTRAIAASSHTHHPIRMTVKDQGRVETLAVKYHGGLRYPHLVRVEGTRDTLDQIIAAKKAKKP